MIRCMEILLSVGFMLLAPSASNATLVESWQFNETAGTQFSGLVNNAGSAAFVSDLAHVSTDGSGALAYSQGANVFRTATLTTKDQASGVFEMEFSILAANLSGGDAAGANVGFGARDENGQDLFLVRLQKTSSTLRLQTRIDGSNSNLVNFGTDILGASNIPLNVRSVFNLSTDLLDVFYTLGTGTEQTGVMGAALNPNAFEFDEVRLVANTNTNDWGASDSVTVDFLTVTAVPEPSAALFLSLVGIVCGVLHWRKRYH